MGSNSGIKVYKKSFLLKKEDIQALSKYTEILGHPGRNYLGQK